jgi:biotin-dependent carboxylase-like uncharacterized protein
MIEILRAGLCDLVMDQGRPGWAALGVPAGGACDPAALDAGNRLVGNDPGAAGLEIVQRGPLLRFPFGAVAALTGARFAARRSSGAPVAWNETLVLAAGETLEFGPAQEGCRAWLALRGGIMVPPVLGSRSTFLPGGFGGQAGRALRASDVLQLGAERGDVHLRRAQPRVQDADAPLRVVPGPQIDLFDDHGLVGFFGAAYRLEMASDRRGLRLAGPAVTHLRRTLPSQGVRPGAVQIPPDGRPIILGWDGPVTGGYPVIATVIRADWQHLAQLRPGDAVRFVTVEVDLARGLADDDPWDIGDIG